MDTRSGKTTKKRLVARTPEKPRLVWAQVETSDLIVLMGQKRRDQILDRINKS